MSRYTKATTVQHSSSFPFVFPFDSIRIEGPERHTLQNFLLRQHNFPNMIRRGDHVAEFWSSTLPVQQWSDALDLISERHRFGSRFLVDDATDQSFLAMCQKLIGRDFKATGGIAVRYTTPEGRPVIRLTVVGVYSEDRNFYSDNTGPHVVKSANMRQFREVFTHIQMAEPLPDAWKFAVSPRFPRPEPKLATEMPEYEFGEGGGY